MCKSRRRKSSYSVGIMRITQDRISHSFFHMKTQKDNSNYNSNPTSRSSQSPRNNSTMDISSKKLILSHFRDQKRSGIINQSSIKGKYMHFRILQVKTLTIVLKTNAEFFFSTRRIGSLLIDLQRIIHLSPALLG